MEAVRAKEIKIHSEKKFNFPDLAEQDVHDREAIMTLLQHAIALRERLTNELTECMRQLSEYQMQNGLEGFRLGKMQYSYQMQDGIDGEYWVHRLEIVE